MKMFDLTCLGFLFPINTSSLRLDDIIPATLQPANAFYAPHMEEMMAKYFNEARMHKPIACQSSNIQLKRSKLTCIYLNVTIHLG